eukprot:CAMPEP_0170518476 /NCGR_PEP_ID=MMETSP0209-20121228/4157_1 /TAXON_ID=665100 ORGANISM="Litonotus pictus, Strain P1" /NCGR_SAMPLE_ID=MMETSP0209 /ASSEMBLY_ACC=CAM_ASM_000301 /LENGTH=523 /DNA_ID=CAMNT_0010804047 /DNA_START=1 /DNA_END=1572 /DNA_ORIENTATION=+
MKFTKVILLIAILVASVQGHRQLFDELEKESDSQAENSNTDTNTNNPPSAVSENDINQDSDQSFLQTNENNKGKEESLFGENKTEVHADSNNQGLTENKTEKGKVEENKSSNTITNKEKETTTENTKNLEAAKENMENNKTSTETVTENTNKEHSKESEKNSNSNKTNSQEREKEQEKEQTEKHKKKGKAIAKKSHSHKKHRSVKTSKRRHRRASNNSRFSKSHSQSKKSSSLKNSSSKKSRMTKRRLCRIAEETGRKLRMCGRGSLKRDLVSSQKKERLNRDSISFLESKISTLKTQMNTIVQTNSQLSSKIKLLEQNEAKNKKKSNKTNEEEMLSFIQKESSHLSSLKKSFGKERLNLRKQTQDKENTFNKLFDKNSFSITFLGDKIHQLEKQIQILHKTIRDSKNHLSVGKGQSERLEAGSISTERLDATTGTLGSLNVNGERIKINQNTKLHIGEKSFAAKDLLNIVHFVELAKKNCGGDFSKCKILNKKEYKAERMDEEEILKNVQKLRADSSKVFDE